MKAILLRDFGSTDNFFLEDGLPMPEPEDGHILVQIKAAAFNPIDYQIRQGKTERKRMHSPILGREFSGIVVKTGKHAGLFKTGDAVFAAAGSMGSNGTYAQYISIPELIAARKPENISFQQAAAVPIVYLTALQTYNRLQLNENDSIFVSGAAGGVGLVLVKLLLANKIRLIIVTAGNPESRQQLIDTGLSPFQIVNYHHEGLAAVILAANSGNQFDHCADMVGGKMSEICASIIKTNGAYADVTALTTAIAREELFNKGAVIINISNYAYSIAGNLAYYGNGLNHISQLLENNIITPPPLHVVGELNTSTVAQAHELLEKNLTKGKKLVMQVS